MSKKRYSDFDAFSEDDRKGVFLEAAQDRGILPLNAEKDYWVCRVLGPVIKQEKGEPTRIFKGGTSLSKGFGIIERFSEDVDIVIARSDLIQSGDDVVDASAGLSDRQRRDRLSKLRKAARAFLHDKLIKRLQAQLPAECLVSVDAADTRGMTLLVAYGSLFPTSGERYNEPQVKIQANINAADFPILRKHVSPYIGSLLPASEWNLTLRSVPIISPERTFWEKVLAIHGRHCRHRDQRGESAFDAKKVSRHYYDLAQLLQHHLGRKALKNLQLLSDCREHDRVAYSEEPWRRPDEAKPGTLFIVPTPEIIDQLKSDFDAMQGMVYGPKVTFDWVMSGLAKIHQAVNGDLFPPELGPGRSIKQRDAK